MGFLSRLHRPSRVRADAGGSYPPDLHPWWYGAADVGWSTLAGVRVSPDLALTIPPFWKAVRILSENIASFQLRVYERLPMRSGGRPGGHAPAADHPYDYTIGRSPNPDLTAFEFWETVVVHIILRGRAYALKRFVPDTDLGRGRLELWPLHPDRVQKVRRPNGAIDYLVQTENGGRVSYTPADIFHLRGMSLDGLDGASMIAYASGNIGAMIAAESFAQRFFKSGVTSAVQAVHPNQIGEDGLKNLHASIKAYITGLENAYGVYVGDEGVELKPIGVEPEKAQLLLTREFTAVQVANWCNLPPGMLGDSKTPTFASSKQFRQDLVDITFRPLTERLEARIDLELLAPSDPDQMRYFSKFEMDALLRGDTAERSQIHERNIRAGWETRNEARLIEDMEPLDGLDEPIIALNMGNIREGESLRAPGEGQARITGDILRTLATAQHLVRKEQATAAKLAKRYADDGAGWAAALEEFYAEHAREVSERLCLPLPVAREYGARQGLRLREIGLAAAEDWQVTAAPELASLALHREAVATYAARELAASEAA